MLPGPRQRLHQNAKPQLVSNSTGALPLILVAVQYQYVLTEKKTQLSREPVPCLKTIDPTHEQIVITLQFTT